jgi:hypothetical protein
MKVTGLKLLSGEEIIGQVTPAGDIYVVKNPVTARAVQEGLAIAPWPSLRDTNANDEVKIQAFAVATVFIPMEVIVEAYQTQFGGIAVAPAGALDLLGTTFDDK